MGVLGARSGTEDHRRAVNDVALAPRPGRRQRDASELGGALWRRLDPKHHLAALRQREELQVVHRVGAWEGAPRLHAVAHQKVVRGEPVRHAEALDLGEEREVHLLHRNQVKLVEGRERRLQRDRDAAKALNDRAAAATRPQELGADIEGNARRVVVGRLDRQVRLHAGVRRLERTLERERLRRLRALV